MPAGFKPAGDRAGTDSAAGLRRDRAPGSGALDIGAARRSKPTGRGPQERQLAIAELNLELELIEPLLATANQTDIARCKLDDPRLDPEG